MQLTLNKRLLRRKIDEHYSGRISLLADRLGVNRSTVSRWVDQGEQLPLPRSSEVVLDLAYALDVDPLALWSWSRTDFPLIIARLLKTARTGRWADFLPALGFLDRLLLPMDHWPPSELTEPAQRLWHTSHARVEAESVSGGLATLHVQPAPARSATANVRAFCDPQIWYVATRSLRSLSPEWFRVGGFIVLSGPALSLHSLSGLSMDAEFAGNGGFLIEVPLGDGVEITIASLHAFAASSVPSAPTDLPTVRFCRPPPTCTDAAGQACVLHEICSVGMIADRGPHAR